LHVAGAAEVPAGGKRKLDDPLGIAARGDAGTPHPSGRYLIAVGAVATSKLTSDQRVKVTKRQRRDGGFDPWMKIG
jgi:hypothetical protein